MANINIKNKTDTKSKSKYIFLFQHLIRFLPPKQTTEQTFYINLRYKNRHIKNYRENVENRHCVICIKIIIYQVVFQIQETSSSCIINSRNIGEVR